MSTFIILNYLRFMLVCMNIHYAITHCTYGELSEGKTDNSAIFSIAIYFQGAIINQSNNLSSVVLRKCQVLLLIRKAAFFM